MNRLELLREIAALYRKHGWQLRRVLFNDLENAPAEDETLAGVTLAEHEVDALWFSRPSHEGREAWELRWLNPAPYALFETFEPDETEEDREEMRLEMQARLREKVAGIREAGSGE
jgi:hypothetical protein